MGVFLSLSLFCDDQGELNSTNSLQQRRYETRTCVAFWRNRCQTVNFECCCLLCRHWLCCPANLLMFPPSFLFFFLFYDFRHDWKSTRTAYVASSRRGSASWPSWTNWRPAVWPKPNRNSPPNKPVSWYGGTYANTHSSLWAALHFDDYVLAVI